MDDQGHFERISIFVGMLVDAVNDLGLAAEPFGGSMVWVINRAADPPPGARMSPRLRQVVQCRMDDLGRLGWYWVWSSPGEIPVPEWFAPAEEIGAAARRIARVLALRPEAAERSA